MIKKCHQFLLALNEASAVRGLRLGLHEFVHGSFAGLLSAPESF
jgi:hypothetical protein